MPKLFSRLRLQPVHYVFAAVLLVRLFVLWRLAGSAFLLPTRGDMHFYDDWAQKVVGGQLTDHHAFYGLPGYAYLLAGLYKLCGYGPYVPELLQALLDAGTALLLYKISVALAPQPNGRRGQIAGLMAAAAWAFCVPAQTYAAVLMPTAWFIFVFWFILWRIIKSQRAPDWWEALLLILRNRTQTGDSGSFALPHCWLRPDFARHRSRDIAVLVAQLFHCAGPRFLVCAQRHQFLDRK